MPVDYCILAFSAYERQKTLDKRRGVFYITGQKWGCSLLVGANKGGVIAFTCQLTVS